MGRKVTREPPWERLGKCPKCGVEHGGVCRDTRTPFPREIAKPHPGRK